MSQALPSTDLILERYRAVVALAGAQENHLLSKSSLYQRMKEGKDPLIIPPPLASSYPWHDVVESDHRHELFDEPWDVDWHSTDAVLIRQDVWTVLTGKGTQEMLVTYPGWQELGFVWRVWGCTVAATETTASLVCWHRKDVQRLTTPELVQAECDARAAEWARWLDNAVSLSEAEMVDLYLYEHSSKGLTAHSRFHQAAGRQKIDEYRKQLDMRLAGGLPGVPTPAEIAKYSERAMTSLLGKDWKIIDGQLMRQTWMMERVSPVKVGPEHYLVAF
ncbi:hypothetical protein [Pseudomonas sp. NPDC089569]|uniref:hypothetical protein n=1 Tax=Pseudomonas sp. NPDC089569 TaxID=3390722 RepID=UPI003D0436E8